MAQSARSRRRAGTAGRASYLVRLSARAASGDVLTWLAGKKAARIEDPSGDLEDPTEHGNQDTPDTDDEGPSDYSVDQHISAIAHGEDRELTSTSKLEAIAPEELPDYESMDERDDSGLTDHLVATEDATLTHFFRSPAKHLLNDHIGSPEKIFYPQLPQSDANNTEPGCLSGTIHDDEASRRQLESELAEGTATEISISSDAIIESVETGEDTPALDSVAYPDLPTEAVSYEDTEGEHSDTEMSDSAATLHVNESLDVGSPCSSEEEASVEADQDFTEASLQLEIQQQCDEQSPPTEDERQAQSPEPGLDTLMARSEAGVTGAQVPEVEVGDEVLPSSPIEIQDNAQVQLSPEAACQDPADHRVDDITNGLSLSFTPARSMPTDQTQRKLHSPPPPIRSECGPDDFTMTVAIDDDTAILKDFLTRAAASKAEKAATHRRESLQNRRDSDVIRSALASPRKVLEDKDPNSPSKYDGELTLDLSQTLTLSLPSDVKISPTPDPVDEEGTSEEKALRGSTRRSSRAKRSRLPAPASISTPVVTQPQTSRINIRRTDGAEVVILKKSNVQELSTLTRANTRKNKQGAFCVTVRLFKLALDAASLPPLDDATKEPVVGKNVRWDETLAYYQENPETVAEAESLATPDELGMEAAATPRTKSKISKSSTPKTRRVRTVNGTPGKGLLTPASLLPEAIQEEKDASLSAPAAIAAQQQQHLPRPKASRIKKMPVASSAAESKLPSLDITPVGITCSSSSSSSRKSRLAAPKKVVLPLYAPPTTTTITTTTTTATTAAGVVDGKENTQRSGGLGDAMPKKGIPAPKVVVRGSAVTAVATTATATAAVAAGMESGLPRRRGRKY